MTAKRNKQTADGTDQSGRRPRTGEDLARYQAIRERFQREKPSLEELVSSGEYNEPLPMGEYLSIRQAVFALRKAREAAGLSLADVAERTGIDKAALSRIETGQHMNPTVSTLCRYAHALGKRWKWVLEDEVGTGEEVRRQRRFVGAATVEVDVECFPPAYLDKADQVFLRPSPLYSWDEIVSGAPVRSPAGGIRRMFAVAQNTFRGFYRVNKACPGAKEGFINYFLEQRPALVEALSAIRTRDDLNRLSNRICEGVRAKLTNCSPAQLRAYNKVRKPVDLYLEHLVAMAAELDGVRAQLVPLLFLPLDSQILAHPGLFTEQELAGHGLSRVSTYKDITAERTHAALQELLPQKAAAVAEARGRPFHVIYFDLVWNGRYRNWGGNLFETNP
jgi:transcriptional regulator with XRE-family HTH domain